MYIYVNCIPFKQAHFLSIPFSFRSERKEFALSEIKLPINYVVGNYIAIAAFVNVNLCEWQFEGLNW